jgi:uncharacterized membrane protein HdeD (DUF308 family)
VILGLLAIVLPPIATFAVEILIGWLLLFGGSALIGMALHARQAGPQSRAAGYVDQLII